MIHHAVIDIGDRDAPSVMMLHGGPGYYWMKAELDYLHSLIAAKGKRVRLLGVQARGCGIDDYITPNPDLLDDNLVKRAQDLAAFDVPDILLGHSTGAMTALTAVIEGHIKPKQLVLLSPYTASLGEQDYWLTDKAAKYSHAFEGFHAFIRDHWQRYKGDIPADLRQNLFVYWGQLFFALPDDVLKLQAKLHYLYFHVISSVPAISMQDSQPVTIHATLLEQAAVIQGSLKDDLLRIATITAHWWQTNYQDGYDFIGRLETSAFDMPIHILSGAEDDITPPHTVKALAELLHVPHRLTPQGRHLAEVKMPGTLQQDLADLLSEIL